MNTLIKLWLDFSSKNHVKRIPYKAPNIKNCPRKTFIDPAATGRIRPKKASLRTPDIRGNTYFVKHISLINLVIIIMLHYNTQ